MSYQLLVCGSRTFSNYSVMNKELLEFLDLFGEPAVIIHGGAHGADSLASRFAYEQKINLHIEGAQWGEYGSSAGPMRNARMASMLMPGDHIFAFVDKPIRHSRGTKHMVRLAITAGFDPRIVEAAAQ